jgi:hypothetical protein
MLAITSTLLIRVPWYSWWVPLFNGIVATVVLTAVVVGAYLLIARWL